MARNLPLLLLSIVACAACSSASKEPAPVEIPALSILQGMTDESTTELSVLTKKNDPLTYELVDAETGRLLAPTRIRRAEREHSDWVYDKLAFSGLEISHVYEFRVRNSLKEIVDHRRLRSLDLKKSQARIAVLSCQDDSYVSEQSRQWRDLTAHSPDLVLMIGDNVYADRYIGPYKGPVDPSTHWARFVETRNSLDFYKNSQLIPTLAIWDDHDFGKNDGDRTFPYIKEVFQTFQDAFAQNLSRTKALHRGPGLAMELSAFDSVFFLMDGRTFRTPNGLKEADETVWGANQESWLTQRLEANGRKKIFLVNGTQYFGGYRPDRESYESMHPKSFSWFKGLLSRTKARVLLISGDAHISELMQIDEKEFGYKTYELTTSGIHAKIISRNWDKNPNPRQLEGNDRDLNFAILDILGESKVNARVYGPGEKLLFSKTLVLP